MNKYIVPICDIQSGYVWNKTITARNISECQDKIMQFLINEYELDDCANYKEFVRNADKLDILIGDIKDIEEL